MRSLLVMGIAYQHAPKVSIVLLTELKQKRNQLTHPKCADDLEVTHEQARRAIVVFIWVHNCLERIREIENAKWSTLYDELLT